MLVSLIQRLRNMKDGEEGGGTTITASHTGGCVRPAGLRSCGAGIPDMVRVKEERKIVPITIIVRDEVSS